jgi:hypothetical protein
VLRKSTPNPPLQKEGDDSSLFQREVRRDFHSFQAIFSPKQRAPKYGDIILYEIKKVNPTPNLFWCGVKK